MKRWTHWLFNSTVLGALTALIVSALLWWMGPLVQIGEWQPFAQWGVRLAWVVFIWLFWGGLLGWRIWRQRKSNAALLKGITNNSGAAERESELLSQRFKEALEKLKGATSGGSWFSKKISLYELPWYVFVGAPGSGKTTALLNSGLQFLLTEAGTGAAVKGIGGTRNCDWWFTSDAVLLDTAGRYTMQESDSEVDAKAWNAFLQLLRKSRPRQPINGVLLTISLQDLLQQNAAQRKEHAAKLRERLQELQVKLGVRTPVYALLTKADLIAGFNETFEAFSKEQRDQVWGFTFDAAANMAANLANFQGQFSALEQRLNSSLFDRLQAERAVTNRTSMFGFSSEIASLRPLLGEFLQMVFSSGGVLQQDTLLRGVYLTSGTQEGTPIDRVMATLSRSYGLQGNVAPPTGQKGKSFFLRRLLQDIVFQEQHLVSFNPVMEKRRSIARTAGFTLVGLCSVALLAGWTVSYFRNQSYAQQVSQGVPELRRQLDVLPPAQSGDVTVLIPALDAIRHGAQTAAFTLESPPFLNTLGLYQGEKLDAAAQIAYRRLLEHALLPKIAMRLEERLRASNKDNLEVAYEALKAYLMLYTPDKFDAGSLKAWISVDWDINLRNRLSPEQRLALDSHLDALLALGAPEPNYAMDPALVASVRDLLSVFPLEYRIYSRIKRQYRDDLPEFSVARAAGPSASLVFVRRSGEPLSKGISGFYSKAGYQANFRSSVQPLAMRLSSEGGWVLGQRDEANPKDLLSNELGDRVRRLYLADYVKTWDKYLDDVQMVRLNGVSGGIEAARVLAAVDSPLAAFLRAVAKETTLVPPATEVGGNVLGKLSDQVNAAKNDLSKLAGVQPAPDAAANGPIERMVDDHFAPKNRLVQGSPAPIEEVLKMFGEVYAQLLAVDAAQKSKSAPPPGGGGERVKAMAGTQPEPIKSMLEALVDIGAKGSREGERDVLTSELKPLFDFCNRAITNRYPFAPGSQADVLPDDFGQVFGGGGMLDDFYQRRLAALVDTGSNPWRYKPLADGAKPATPAALADFQRAARIREGFFRSGGKQPGFKLEIRALEMLDGMKELTLDVDGVPLKFVAGNATSQILTWPSQKVSSQIRVKSVPSTAALGFDGPWALFRFFDRFEIQQTSQPEKFIVLLNLDGKRVRLEVIANSVINPFRMREMQQFRCPGAL